MTPALKGIITLIIFGIASIILKRSRLVMIDVPEADWLTKYFYAHRGLHDGKIPENSLTAFAKAVDAGYGIELDVRLTKDGKLVVFHDDNTLRMTGIKAKAKNLTLKQIKEFYLKGTKERIPELKEVLELVAGKVPILFELKSHGLAGALEPALYEAIKDYDGKYAVQSFSPFSMWWFRVHAPHILRGQLACDIRFCSEGMSFFKRNFLKLILMEVKLLETNFICKPNFISYEYHKIGNKVIEKLRKRGAVVLAWTIRDEQTLTDMQPYFDGFIFERLRPEYEKITYLRTD